MSMAVSVVVSSAVLVIVTLAVAWALEDTVYFSLFVGIPVGIASSLLTFALLRRLLKER